MAAQFGNWNFDGATVLPGFLEKVRALLTPYGPDGEGVYRKDGVSIMCRAFHTTKEAIAEKQPVVSALGVVIVFDGRLDNREDLVRELNDIRLLSKSEALIVLAAYQRWKTDCFERIIGDWAISIWDPHDRSLLLAKDFLGTRPLYYAIENDRVSWCTILDPLVLLSDRDFALDEEYIAGWLSSYPAAHLTPYVGIHAVPPASFVMFRPRGYTVHTYWDFDGAKKIRYRTDAEYEEHYRTVFAESVRRRLRSSSPILAELSGGMDSSSIVCMADEVGSAGGPRVDTMSYFNDDEPNWNERPYFRKVEEKRGRAGLHVNASSDWSLTFDSSEERIELSPGGGRRSHTELTDWIRSQEHRVVLSGIGGDEVNGGVPTPIPQLEDLLARARLSEFAQRLKIWALKQRRPWIYLLIETASGFMPVWLRSQTQNLRPGIWIRRKFVHRYNSAFLRYERRLRVFGPLPSFQENLVTLDALRRQLAGVTPQTEPLLEKRYPYLDRDFLEFMYAIPREQLVRPGHRRSLMRRALKDIVPEEILHRSRKAYVSRSPIAAITNQYPQLVAMCEDMVSGSLGFVAPDLFRGALEDVRLGRIAPGMSLMRTLGVECWLKNLRAHGLLDDHKVLFSQSACKPEQAAQLSH
jgi:asparagine synthase (glutamine-hydrolysing)